ncbi:peroxiredoxin-like family protein [soil metagenome]
MKSILISTLLIFILNFSSAFSQTKTIVALNAADVIPLRTGESIPSLTLKNINGEDTDLSELISQKPTVLIFYRGGWCPYCNLQLSGLQKIESDLTALGYQIVAISADKPEKIKETITKDILTYTILSDNNSVASTAFGLAFKVDDNTVEKYKGYKIDLDEASGNNNHILPVPAVYLIDTNGKIKFDYYNPDYKTRLDTEELLKAANSYK